MLEKLKDNLLSRMERPLYSDNLQQKVETGNTILTELLDHLVHTRLTNRGYMFKEWSITRGE